MFDPQMDLLLTVMVSLVGDAPTTLPPTVPATWGEARAAMHECGTIEPDVVAALEAEDMDTVRTIIGQWYSGSRHMAEHDRAVLKRALKAFRKRLKVTLLDAESSLGGGPMSGGRTSTIVGITPPHRYPRAVWDELVRLGRLRDSKHGMFELPPGG